ncbi:MAG: hypothetical protein WAS21_06010 [Geminicoccaceae bacterium]
MHRSLVPVLSLALLGCATTQPVQPMLSPAVSTMAAPAPSLDLQVADLRVASLPARPAGAAFAMAGEEHALVRAPIPAVMPATPSSTTATPSLAAHVLAAQAAYRRWCAGEPLPGDTTLLSRAGGTALPGAIACTPSSTAARGRPRALVPAMP